MCSLKETSVGLPENFKPGQTWDGLSFLVLSEVDDGCWLPRKGSWPLSKVVLCRHTQTVDS